MNSSLSSTFNSFILLYPVGLLQFTEFYPFSWTMGLFPSVIRRNNIINNQVAGETTMKWMDIPPALCVGGKVISLEEEEEDKVNEPRWLYWEVLRT